MQASTPLFYDFNALTRFSNHIFSKLLFLLERGQHFCKTISNDFNQKFHIFDPQTASIRAFFVIWFALIALLAVPIAIFSLHARIKILLLAAVPCIFRPQSPVSKNECMHRCNNFVNFVYDLLFSLCLPCFEHLFFTKYHPIFWKYAPRPRWEAWFWKRHKSKIMKNVPLRPSNYACMHPFCTTYCNLKFAKSIGKICIFCL